MFEHTKVDLRPPQVVYVTTHDDVNKEEGEEPYLLCYENVDELSEHGQNVHIYQYIETRKLKVQRELV